MQTRTRGSRLLTPRELTVLRLVAAGLSNRAIAESLAITERTVKFHVTALFNKLGADNRAQAVALAGRRGILPPDQD
jgi:DNA-binding NarL/FixJ family response regulator